MRYKILLFCCFLGFGLSNPFFSQTKSKSFLSRIFSPDSLRNFDESAYRISAITEGLIGVEFDVALMNAKKQHIINTYYPNAYDIGNYKTGPANNIMNAPCVNEGFEMGNFTGWILTSGQNTNSCAYPTATVPLAAGPLATVLTTPLVDPVTGFLIPNSPLGGTRVARLNNNAPTGKVIKMTQNFVVTNSNYLYDFVYFGVENGIHTCCQQPNMKVRLRDCVGNLLACPNFSFNAPASNSLTCPGTGPAAWINTGICPGGQCVFRSTGWQKYSIDLTQYIGTCVTIEVMVADCSPTGHYLYTYFDSNCNTMNLTVNGTNTVSMPTQTVTPFVLCGTTATLTAPSGLNPYLWNGPPLSGVVNNTNQTISSAVAGNYTLVMNPVGVCTPIFRVINLTFVPPASITVAPPGGICPGINATLTASGATNYTWNPGGSNSATIVVSPTATTIYTLTANTGSCTGTFTAQVVANPGPTVGITASSMSVCAGMPTTLTGSGATSYSWSTGSMVNPTVVSPTTTTTYSVVGTTTAGCTGTANITINVVGSPTFAFAIASPTVICNGSSSNLFASAAGATGYTWNPGGLVGAGVTVSPTVTTIYTVIAANGGCTNSAQVTVSVSNGPTMTAMASPTSICPGSSATLSASGAVSYTWFPMNTVASSVVVTPTVTTTYTVVGANGVGCTSTLTISEVVNPVPSITISPASPSICIGTSGTLTASGASTYTWNPGGLTGAVVVVSPTTSTTYTIIGSNGSCTSSVTKSLTVVPIPTVTASGSSPSICAGSSATLTGGGATTYTWNPGGLTGVNVTVSPTITTTYTVTGSTGGCSSSATVGLTVNNGPTLTANATPTNICAGGSSTLTVSGGLSYTWNPGALTGSNVVVNPPSTTVYSVTGVNGFGCTTTKTVMLNVTPNPTVSASASSASICIGSSATLTGIGATTYTWNPGGLTGGNVVVTPTTNTTYTVTGATAGCTGQNTITINVILLPTVTAVSNPTAICSGSSGTLTGGGATSYTWNPGGLTGTNVVVTPTITTTYTVTGSVGGGCSNTATVSLTVNNGPTLTTNATPTNVCAGGSSTLTVSGGLSYTWNPGALTGSNVVVTPTATTIYSVTGNNAFGCLTTRTVMVNVTPNPTVSASASSSSICIGSSATLTGIGATSYTWNPGGLTGGNVVVTPTTNTTYTVIGSTAGCNGQNTIAINVVPLPTVTAASSPTAICNGGSATLTANGATTYTWNPGALTGSSVVVSPVVNTTYTVTGNNGACSATSTVALIVNPNPTLTSNASPTAVCITGNVTLTANGATTYTWNPGALTGSNVVVTPTITTTYTVTGSTGFGCTGTSTTNVVVNTIPVLTLAATPTAICNGSSSTLTALGALNYTWNPGALTGSNVVVSPTATTIYTVTASNGGCSTTGTLNLIVNPNPTLIATATPTNICAGNSSTLTAVGAITYTWNPGALTGSNVVVTPTATTLYTVTGTNIFGCSSTGTVNLIVTPVPTVVANASPTAVCLGSSSTLTATGATTYTWNPGALTGSNVVVTPTATTNYTVTGSNGQCSNTQTVSVIVNPIPTLTAGAFPNPVCLGASVTMTVSGGATYTWTPGPLTGSNVVVSPTINTTYTVLGASIFGCTNTAMTTVTVNPLPTLTVTSTNTNICAGASATLTGSGAVTYTWNPGAMSGSTFAVSPTVTTVYTLTGTSALGCTTSITFTQVVTPIPTITAMASPTAICIGGGSTLTATGATNYTWNPGALTGSNIVVTPTVSTTYTVTGANGLCSSTQTVSLIVNPTPTLTANASPNPVCFGTPVTLTVTGGATYTWNPGALTGSNVVVTPTLNTTYTVIGASAFGCTSTAMTNVTVNPLPSLTVTSSNTNICAGSSATLTASGGVSYIWNPGGVPGATLAISPSVTTIYTLSGTSGFGCLNTITFTQVVTPIPTITAVASPTAICIGGGSTLTASGATTYTWNPGALTGSNIVVTPTVSTTYTIIGANGLCSSTQTVSLIVNPIPTITANASPNPVCIGSTVGLTAGGGVTYTWNPGALTGSNVIVTPTTNTTYTVIGATALGCTNTAMTTVTVNPLPSLTVTSTNTNICAGASATLTGSGATSYTWNPGASIGSTLAISPTVTTVYTLSGTSAFGCLNTITFTQVVTPNPTVVATASLAAICNGQTSTLTATGATTYSWNPGALTGSNIVVTPTATTIYTVVGANGLCTNTQTVSVTVSPTPTLTAGASPSVFCIGNSSTLTVNGAITYTWNPGALTGSNIVVTPTVNTSYTVTGTNGSGCTNTVIVNVTVNPLPTLSITSTATNICAGTSATLTGSGAATYTWDPGAVVGTTIAVTPTATTVYTLTGSSLFTCSNSAQFTLVVSPNPTVTVSASNTVMCSGNSTTLTANGAGSYTWSPGALTGSNIVVTPTVTTTYTVVGNNGPCTSSAVITITVNPTPSLTANATPTLICSGSTVTLTATGGVIYAWLPVALTGATITDSPTVTTTYTVIGSNGTCTNVAVVTVSVNASPTLTALASPTAVCFGNSSTLTATGATNYTWSPGGLNTATVVVSPTVTTTYTLVGANGSCSSSLAVSVTVNPNPTITVNATPTLLCAGSTVSLTAGGASTYTWSPGGATGASVTANPTITTVYTVSATDINGCGDMASITVSINPAPTFTAVSSPTSICVGGSATLSASGQPVSYTANVGAMPGSSIVVNPTITTTYTITGTDLIGCTNSMTVQLIVLPSPTVTVSSSPTAICLGNSATLTANGALTYTWNPGALTGSNVVVNPTITTEYTVTGSNGLCGSGSTTLLLVVNEVPANVTASVSGAISCGTPSVNLLGNSTSTNVAYLWSGPGAYTAAAQSPTGIGIPGIYTLTVLNLAGGCTSTATVAVITDSSVPTVTISVTGTITCANPSATLTAATSATNAGYSWTGPGAFTSTAQSCTITSGGSYTLTVTDLNSSCPASTVVTIISNTNVPITATITPATCNGTVANNDAMITVSGFGAADKYDFNVGATYTGTATYATATLIPITGILTNTLNNPLSVTPYTARLFGANGCFKDTTLFLSPTSCLTNTVFGIAKAVGTPSLQLNGTYNVSYSIVVKNSGIQDLNNVVLDENLSNTFPAPTTFSIISPPLVTSLGTSLVINPAFDGTLQTVMTNTSTSILPAGKSDTIVFMLNINPNGNFGPFNNTVIGFASPTVGVVFGDSSNTGFDPDPDLNGNPTDNNLPTVLNLQANLFFGLTKVGALSDKRDDNSYDISYTITIHNLGNDTLLQVSVKDSLFNNTIKQPGTYIIKAGPITSGSLTANTNYNGNSDVNLLNPLQSKMPPGAVGTIEFTLNVNPDTMSVVKNSAYGWATSSSGSVAVSDTSNSGNNPDSNNNGIWNEAVDNVPTVLTIPNGTLFVPNGFSPDGDNKNDLWIIKGLPADNTVTIYNRWGNKVYQKSNYDNTWNGHPNVSGTLGNQKLSQGTYYYVIEFKDGSIKPLNGFVVIQY